MNCIHFESIDSTNKYLKNHYLALENFTFVSAGFQSEGKGREDRTWISHKNENLLFSFLIKEKDLLEKFKILSTGIATLIARFLELKGVKNVSVKWPNDVYVNDKKICGILLEGNVNKYLVVGAGLNVNQSDFVGEYRNKPTSMKMELNKTTNLNEIEVELFEFIYKHLHQPKFKINTLKFYRSHDYLLNKKVSIKNISGIASGVTDDFDLIVDGKSIDSGEVIL